MKTSVNLRFGLYVFLMTTIFVVTVYSLCRDIRFPPIFYILFPSVRKILGPNYKEWHESDRDISDRALVWSFFGFLVVFWIAALYIGFHIDPAHQSPRYIIWTVVGILWMVCIYPGYRWWRVQKKEANA